MDISDQEILAEELLSEEVTIRPKIKHAKAELEHLQETGVPVET